MKDIEKSRLDLQKAIEQKSLLEKSIKEIKESEEYREHHRLISEKDRHEKKIGEISRQISDYFSPLRPGLKKYAHMSLDEKSVNSYIQDPVKALLSDRECRIIGIVKDMTTALEKGSLEMKDKKLEKTVSAATSFEGTDLKTMAEEMQKALQQKHDTEDMIRQTHVRDYDEAEYRLNHMNDKIRLLEAEIRDKEKAAGQIKPEEHRRKAMNMVKNLGIELEITSASA